MCFVLLCFSKYSLNCFISFKRLFAPDELWPWLCLYVLINLIFLVGLASFGPDHLTYYLISYSVREHWRRDYWQISYKEIQLWGILLYIRCDLLLEVCVCVALCLPVCLSVWRRGSNIMMVISICKNGYWCLLKIL